MALLRGEVWCAGATALPQRVEPLRRGYVPGVELTWEALTVDVRNPLGSAQWWAETLGWEIGPATEAGVEVRPPDGRGPSLFFVASTADKHFKNRLHLDLSAADQAVAVELLEARGAVRVDVGQGDAAEWVVLRDPEGNEFCLLEPAAS